MVVLLAVQLSADSLYRRPDWVSSAKGSSVTNPEGNNQPIFLDRSLTSLQLEPNVAASQELGAGVQTNVEQDAGSPVSYSVISNPDRALGEEFQYRADNPSIFVLAVLILVGAIWRAYHSPSYAKWYHYFFGPLDEY